MLGPESLTPPPPPSAVSAALCAGGFWALFVHADARSLLVRLPSRPAGPSCPLCEGWGRHRAIGTFRSSLAGQPHGLCGRLVGGEPCSSSHRPQPRPCCEGLLGHSSHLHLLPGVLLTSLFVCLLPHSVAELFLQVKFCVDSSIHNLKGWTGGMSLGALMCHP